MKLKLPFILSIYLWMTFSYGQTECTLDETKLSGTFTTSAVGGTKIKASDATSNYRFGERVAIDGNIAVTVSRTNGVEAGKVYIFTNDGAGNWTQQTTLTASDGFVGDNFGTEVAIEGNYLVVGARSQLDTNGVDTGAAYLFEYNGVNTWTEVAKFEPSDGVTDYRFGTSVAIEGDLILIGARKGCVGGCAYLYENDGTNTFTYTETKLEPQVQSSHDGARFGETVVLKDGRAYVGGPYDFSSVGKASAGSVQIWEQANDGTWSRTHRLRGTETSESFGWEFDVEGEYLAVGAMNFEVSSTPEADQGRVFVYKADSNGDYLEANKVMIQNDDKDSFPDQRFGSAVALEDGYLYVGTWGAGSTSGDAVYIFKDDGTNNWTQISKITSGSGWDEFSNRAVAVSFPNLLIGQNEDDSPSNSGAIHFVPLASTITPTASVTETTDAFIGQDNGTITVNFNDEPTRTEIAFSIDGGTTYPYVFNDDAGSGAITNLGVGSFSLKAKFEEGSCILDMGTVTINQASYTAIPDANFEAELESQGYDDISGDGQVPTVLIESVTILNISNKGIADLTGIEDFLALEELKANGNNLTAINLTNNTALKVLWLRSGNNNFASIDVSNNVLLEDFRIQYSGTSLDISNNTALIEFMCLDCNLTTLDTSTNTDLTSLDLEGSDITSLDLSSNTNLSGLDIGSTSLIRLDLSNNTGLRFFSAKNITTLTGLNIQNGNNTNIVAFETVGTPVPCVLVDDATYSATNWTDVEVATIFRDTGYCLFTQIPDANFEAALNTLGYDDNLGDGKVPTELIEGITTIDVSNEAISDLTGIEDFVALTSLNVDDNNLTAIDISNNSALEFLFAQRNQLAALDISQNTQLQTLNVTENPISFIDVSNNDLISRLRCPNTNISTLDITNLTQLDYLEANVTQITSLDLSQNTVLRFANLQNTNLTSIDVSANVGLTDLWLSNTQVPSLDLTNNVLLVSVRTLGTPITELDLSNQTALIRYLGQNGALEKLNLKNGNNANMTNVNFNISGNPSLTCVLVDDTTYSTNNWANVDVTTSFSDTYCHYTAIPDANFEAALHTLGYDDIANDGQVPTALIEGVTNLNVSNQNIADVTGIEDFTALVDLNLDGNVLTSLDVSNNTNLQTLVFDNNSVATLNLGTISNLTEIEGRYNQLTTIDLSLNTNLTFINLRNNLLTSIAISNNPLLETITLRGNANLTSLDLSNKPNLKSLFLQDTGLTGLDVSQNLLLENIVIERVNFNTIDVSNLPNLKQLRIANNSFTHLDVSNNPALVRLECENNNLTYLNLKNGNNTNVPNADFKATGNPLLTCIIVDDATWSATNWTNIDVTSMFTNSYCRYTAIPDANFEAELEALGYDDISGDGQVPTALIEVLSTLTVDNKNINDLTGIADFKALTYLNCRRNNLATLDISQNTQLTYFNAAQNDLTTVDVSNNTLLESLYLFSNNLTTIDLTNNTALKFLYIQRNVNLPSFDISNNILLEEIDCSETNITALVTTNNTLLRWLEVYESSLVSIDLSTNTALELLRLFDTNVTELNVSNNTSLTELRINNTGIQALDLSNQIALTTFVANDANLSYLNIQNGNNTNVPPFAFNVTNNPNLTCVIVDDVDYSTAIWTLVDATTSFSDTYCRYTAIPDANFEARLEALGHDDISGDGQVPTALIEVVSSLTVNGNSVADFTGIEDFTSLTYLDVGNNNITSIDVSNLLLLEFLRVDGNPLTSLDISTNTALVDLRCSFVSAMTSIDISNNTLLETAHISSNAITSLDVTNNPLLYWLQINNTPITTIDLSMNIALREFQCANGVLTSLDLSTNIALEELILSNNTLPALDLSSNTALRILNVNGTGLSFLNLKNGNNTNLVSYNSLFTTNLSCVLVDDEGYSNTNWTSKASGTSFSDTYCRYTAIPDSIFEAELEALGYDDISGDGQVPTSLVEGVTSLALPNKGINDLTGIEDFVALTSLNCRVNNLTALNVTQNVLLSTLTADSNSITAIDLSNNKDLEILNLAGSNLTAIDVTNNTELRKLFLQGNSGLTSIDISNNTKLVEFRTYNTNIGSLDISVHPDLELLESYNTPLTAIDVSNNPLLEVLRVDNTNITSLDVSNNPNLRSLRAHNTGIESLDLSNQTALQALYAHDTSLNYLNVKNGNNTNIITFEADNNPNLTCILVDDETYSTTNWTNIDTTASFSDTYCRYTAIPDANFEARLGLFGYDDVSSDGQVPTALIEVVEFLILGSQSITDLTGIEDFTALKHLSCNNNLLTSLDLSNNSALEELDFLGNAIDNIDLSTNTNLIKLVGSSNNLTSIDLSQNVNLKELDIDTNLLMEIDLSANTLLELVDVNDNALTSIDFTYNTQLIEVYLSNNTIGNLDLSNQSQLEYVECIGCSLNSVNLQNGNNVSVQYFDMTNNPDLLCVLVDNAAYSTTNWTNIDSHTSFSETSCTTDFSLAIKVYLQGATLNPNTGEESLMRDDLRVNGYLPTTSPYEDNLTCDSSVFNTTGNNAIVDWVWVELRDAMDNTVVSYSRSALLQRDGDVVDVDGTSLLLFSTVNDNYYMVVNHRNHLGIMTNTAIDFSVSNQHSIDFTNASTPITYGTNAQTSINMPRDVVAMWAGDAEGNGDVNFSFDGNKILLDLLLHPNNSSFSSSYTFANGYYNADIDLSGNISFQEEYNNLLFNVLLYPSNTSFSSSYTQVVEQLPTSSIMNKTLVRKSIDKQREEIQLKLNGILSKINK